MKSHIKLELVKDKSGITVTENHGNTGVLHFFDETEEARKSFVKFMVEFMNTEVKDGAKYQ